MMDLTLIESALAAGGTLASSLAWFYKRRANQERQDKSYEQAKLEALHELYDKLIKNLTDLNGELSEQVKRLTTEIDRLKTENEHLTLEVERLTAEVRELRERLQDG